MRFVCVVEHDGELHRQSDLTPLPRTAHAGLASLRQGPRVEDVDDWSVGREVSCDLRFGPDHPAYPTDVGRYWRVLSRTPEVTMLEFLT